VPCCSDDSPAASALVRQVQAPPTAGSPFADRYFGCAVGAALLLASALRVMCLHLVRSRSRDPKLRTY
jgi:hypothetical protein